MLQLKARDSAARERLLAFGRRCELRCARIRRLITNLAKLIGLALLGGPQEPRSPMLPPGSCTSLQLGGKTLTISLASRSDNTVDRPSALVQCNPHVSAIQHQVTSPRLIPWMEERIELALVRPEIVAAIIQSLLQLGMGHNSTT